MQPIIDESASFLDRLAHGGKVTLFGMATVFSILLILYVVLTIMKVVFTKKEAQVSTKETKPPVAITPIKEKVELKQDESELVAVITAAIAASTGKPASSFRVVSFRQK